jgi:hypothetical protein
MKKIVFATYVTLSVIFFNPYAVGQELKTTIAVNHSGDDLVGQRLIFAIRETIRSSHGYQIESSPRAAYRINIVTMDPESGSSKNGLSAIAAVTIVKKNTTTFNPRDPQTWYPIYLTTSVVSVGSKRVDEISKSIVAMLESEIEEYKSDVRQNATQ